MPLGCSSVGRAIDTGSLGIEDSIELNPLLILGAAGGSSFIGSILSSGGGDTVGALVWFCLTGEELVVLDVAGGLELEELVSEFDINRAGNCGG